MKAADITVGGDYAYRRSSRSWGYASRVTVVGTEIDGKIWKWARQDDFRLNAIRKQFNLPEDSFIVIADENANVLVGGDTHGIQQTYTLLNSRFIVSTWADEEARREDEAREAEKVREALAAKRVEREAREARKAEERARWASEFPAVAEAFTNIGLTVAQGVEGISLNPEQAKAVADALRAYVADRVA